jgi:hypothetical protein
MAPGERQTTSAKNPTSVQSGPHRWENKSATGHTKFGWNATGRKDQPKPTGCKPKQAINAQPLKYAPHCILQSIFRPAARRQNREGRRTADRRDGGLKMDWTKPLHNAPSYGR